MPHDREAAWALLCEYTDSLSLRRHALAVEAILRHSARETGEDEELWGCCGLLHDFDYERWPNAEEHTVAGGRILAEQGWPEELIRAIHSHNPANGLGVPMDTPLAKHLFAGDEISGFITGVALVRPSKSLHDLKAKSVSKKMKEKGFCAAVNREELRQGAELVGRDFAAHVDFCIQAMRGIAGELGLDGEAA